MTENFSISAIARLLGVDRRTATRLVEGLQPTGSHRGNPLFRLADVVRAIVGGRQPANGDISLAEAKRRRSVAEAVIAEAEARRIEGSTILIEAAVEPLTEQCSIIRNRFLALPSRATPRVVGREHAAVFAILHEEVVGVLKELSVDADMRTKAAQVGSITSSATTGNVLAPADDRKPADDEDSAK